MQGRTKTVHAALLDADCSPPTRPYVVVRVVIQSILVAETGLKSAGAASKMAQNRRNRSPWTRPLTFRDREAPGSNPGPPTKVPLFELAARKGPANGSFRATAPSWPPLISILDCPSAGRVLLGLLSRLRTPRPLPRLR
jgi:hypothetical protein